MSSLSCGQACFYTLFVVPVVSAIKFAICIVPVAVIMTGGVTLISIGGVFYDVGFAYWSVAISPQLGKNVTALTLLTMIVPILLIPSIFIGCSIIISTLGLLGFVIFETFGDLSSRDGDSCYSSKAIKYAYTMVNDYWNMSFRTKPEYYRKLRSAGTFFEIKFKHVVYGLILSALGMLIDGTMITILLGVKLVPAVLRGIIQVTRLYGKSDPMWICVCLCPYLVGLALVVGGIPASYPILCIVATFYGMKSTVIMYQNDSFMDGFSQILHTIWQADVFSNEMVFGTYGCSCCFGCLKMNIERHQHNFHLDANPIQVIVQHPDPPVRVAEQAMAELKIPDPVAIVIHPLPHEPPRQAELTRISALRIWSSFFTMCTVQGKQALDDKFCTRDTITNEDPSFIIGLPALVILRAIKPSEHQVGIELADSLVITEMNRPTDPASDVVYPWLIQIKQGLKNLLLTHEEYKYMERWVVMGDDPDMCQSIVVPAGMTEKRNSDIKRVTSQVAGLATRVTQMPTFHRMFSEATSNILKL